MMLILILIMYESGRFHANLNKTHCRSTIETRTHATIMYDTTIFSKVKCFQHVIQQSENILHFKATGRIYPSLAL